MNIVGLETIIFGVEDVAACANFLTDYGLIPVDVTEAGVLRHSMGVVVLAHARRTLTSHQVLVMVVRCANCDGEDSDTIDAITAELSKDREKCVVTCRWFH
ncbi:hypothetical protein P4S72_05955 [Vibrio sp. PP-XX7]